MACSILVHAEHLHDYLIDLRGAQRSELLNDESAKPQERLFGAAQHRIRVALGFIVGAEQNYFLALDLSGDEMQQLERRGVGPLQILEHDEERLLARQTPEELGKVPQQTRLDLRRISAGSCSIALSNCSEIGKQLPEIRGAAPRQHRQGSGIQLSDEGQQGIREQSVRYARLDRIGATDGNIPAALGRTFGSGGGKTRLADSTFPHNEDRTAGTFCRFVDCF